MENEMQKETLQDFVELIDDDGNEMKFEVLDSLNYKDRCFYALLPSFELPDDSEDSEEEKYFIFEAKKSDSDEEEIHFEEVNDDNILDELSVIFEKHFEEML